MDLQALHPRPTVNSVPSIEPSAIAEFIASIGLALCTLIAATVVSVGIARADVVSSVIDNEGGVFAIALLLGLLFIGMGGVTIISLPHQSRHRKTHS